MLVIKSLTTPPCLGHSPQVWEGNQTGLTNLTEQPTNLISYHICKRNEKSQWNTCFCYEIRSSVSTSLTIEQLQLRVLDREK